MGSWTLTSQRPDRARLRSSGTFFGRHSGKGASRRQSGEVPLAREQAPARVGPFGYGPAGPTTLNALVCTPAGMLPDTPPTPAPTLPPVLAASMGLRDRIVAGSTTPTTGTSLPVKAMKGTTRWSSARLLAGGSPPAKAANGASAIRLADRDFVTVNLLAATADGMREWHILLSRKDRSRGTRQQSPQVR